MINNLIFACIVLSLMSCSTLAQEKITEHIYKRTEASKLPTGNIEDFDILIGEWHGEDNGSTYDELWMEPMNNTMHGIFRLEKAGEIDFTEYLTIVKDSISYAMKIKHFTAEFEGWEEKDDAVVFRFIKRENNTLYLSGLTADLIDKNNLMIYVAFRQDDDSVTEGKFAFTKKIK